MNFNAKKITQRQISKYPQINYASVSEKFDSVSVWVLFVGVILIAMASLNFTREVHRHRNSYFITTTGKTIPLKYSQKIEDKIHSQLAVFNNENEK